MGVTAADLRTTYQPKTTAELLRLRNTDITDLAAEVIEAELLTRGEAPPPRANPPPVNESATPGGSFFQGRQPLLKTFVIIGVVGMFVVQLVGLLLGTAGTNLLGRPWGGFLQMSVVVPYMVYSSVAVWRSAGRSKSFAGSAAAKLVVIPWVLFTIAYVFFGFREGLKTLGVAGAS